MRRVLCAWLPAFRLQAAAGCLPAAPALAWERQGLAEIVVALNAAAAAAGIQPGMTVAQAQGRCRPLACRPSEAASEAALSERLRAAAAALSPRVQMVSRELALLDMRGLERLHGPPAAVAARLEAPFTSAGLRLRTGRGVTPTAALMAARSGLGELPAGHEAEWLAPLPIGLLRELQELTCLHASPEQIDEMLALLARWGIGTLGALAQLEEAALTARLGQAGAHLRALARGADGGLLHTPPATEPPLESHLAFESPIADLERLQAALASLLAARAPELEARDRLVERLEVLLDLEGSRVQYTHRFATPTRALRTLGAQLQLELERQTPRAAVEGVHVRLHPCRPRPVQTRLFAAAPPDREKMPQLLARLAELYDDAGHQRVGSPQRLDTHRPQGFTMTPFAPPSATAGDETDAPRAAPALPQLALRIFRPPQPLGAGVRLLRRAGPWRSRGAWWREPDPSPLPVPATGPWACDEWDAELSGGLPPGLYRLLQELASGRWYILGRYD